MRPKPRKQPVSSDVKLDNTVYRLVREFLEDQARAQIAASNDDDELTKELSEREADLNLLLNLRKLRVSEAIDICQRAELSLRRVKRDALEKSIEKVKELIRKEEKEKHELREQKEKSERPEHGDGDAELDSDFEGVDMDSLMEVKNINQMNKSVVNLWNIPPLETIESGSGSGPEIGPGFGDGAGAGTIAGSNNTLTNNSTATTPMPISLSDQSIPAKNITQSSLTDGQPERKRAKNENSGNKKSGGSSNKKDKLDRRPAVNVSLQDLGGIEKVIKQLLEMVAWPLTHPEVYAEIGSDIPRGVLLHGPPGCGKTMLANALANDLGVAFINVSAPSIVSGMSGESEKKLREIFDEAKTLAPSLVFIDEIDAITPKRESAQREMERRIVAQLLTCMDDVAMDKTGGKPVMIIGATNRPDAIDSALRRGGRFDREICMNVPDQEARQKILQTMSRKLKLEGGDDFNFKKLAKMTPGYVGADLNALVTAAGACAIKRILGKPTNNDNDNNDNNNTSGTTYSSILIASKDQNNTEELLIIHEASIDRDTPNGLPSDHNMDIDTTPVISLSNEQDEQIAINNIPSEVNYDYLENDSTQDITPVNDIRAFIDSHPKPLSSEELFNVAITFDDFMNALPSVQPSSKREGFTTVPDVTWDDVGAMTEIREELEYAIVESIKNPELYAAAGIRAPSGVLLWGPPGCGKTLLAKAVANESQANFISVRGPELLNKYVGESERAVRQVFVRARASEPCVIFFDELDALVPRRDDSNSESSSRVVNTLLTELDGVGDRKGVYVIAATNRPDMIDSAMLRPGRLDKQLYVELPTAEERVEILKTVTRSSPIDPSVDLASLGHDERCRNFSGADLANLTREAAGLALRTVLIGRRKVGNFEDGPANVQITAAHFEEAFSKVKASVSDADRAKYNRMKQRSG